VSLTCHDPDFDLEIVRASTTEFQPPGETLISKVEIRIVVCLTHPQGTSWLNEHRLFYRKDINPFRKFLFRG
jgi:hypothetical protein